MASVDISNQAAAGIATPSSGNTTLFVDTDKLLKSKDDAGLVVNYGAVGSSITSLTGEVSASGPGAAAATVSNSAVLGKLLTGLSPVSGTLSATDSIIDAFNKLAARNNSAVFPFPTDGDVVISSDFTLVRDMYYNSLVVNSGVTLFTGGFRILSATSITNNGTIDRSGNNGLVSAAGAALAVGTLGGSGAGGAGGTAAGSAGGGVTTSLGGAGGVGGATGSAGGTAGTATVPAATVGGVEVVQTARQAAVARDITNIVCTGGGGGGGGAGDGTAGGGGGGGGAVIVCVARNILGSGVFKSMGGNGGTPAGGNRGGGAGGGGGAVILVSENDTTLTSLTFNVSGGVGSSGTGTGGVGNNGSVGRVYKVRV